DPNNRLRVFAGTGEYNDTGGGTYYGNGLLISADGGDSWTEVTGGIFEKNEISQILFDPTDATSQQMFLASDAGVYESADGGLNWTLLPGSPGSTGALVVTQPAGPAGTVGLVAGAMNRGLYTTTRTSGAWPKNWTQVTGSAIPASFGRIALG